MPVEDGSLKLRLPRCRYSAFSQVDPEGHVPDFLRVVFADYRRRAKRDWQAQRNETSLKVGVMA